MIPVEINRSILSYRCEVQNSHVTGYNGISNVFNTICGGVGLHSEIRVVKWTARSTLELYILKMPQLITFLSI